MATSGEPTAFDPERLRLDPGREPRNHEFRDGWRQITHGPPVMPDLIAEYKARESMTKEDSGLRNWF
jgi:hypothetical protein